MVQACLQRWCGGSLVDLHVSDLLNEQLPSQHDYTSWYDLMVMRRLAQGALPDGTGHADLGTVSAPASSATAPTTPAAWMRLDTRALGWVVFDRVLLSVHPSESCTVREHFAQRLPSLHVSEARSASRLPLSPADLMLRQVNHLVDAYLELRRALTRELGDLQAALLHPKHRFDDWPVLLEARNALNHLEDLCEDQRSAAQEWIDALDEWPAEATPEQRRERELLRVRSRDVHEHIERVLGHVRRLQGSAESAVQMHFSAQSNRTNDIMRTLTVLTAIFLPLNLITGFFGMNFDALPLIHSATGVWVAGAVMLMVALGLGLFFWRKRYLGTLLRR